MTDIATVVQLLACQMPTGWKIAQPTQFDQSKARCFLDDLSLVRAVMAEWLRRWT